MTTKLNRWEAATSTGNHFDVLDGLRGFAILLVVAHHALYTNPAQGVLARLAGFVIEAGGMGVPIFFVLSGFLISYPFFQKRDLSPGFWYLRGHAARRMAKILPPFYLSILVFVAFYWCSFHDLTYVVAGLKWGAGVGAFTPISPSFNAVYWSLMTESEYYVLLPLLFWLTRGLTIQQTGVVIFLLLFSVPLIARQYAWPENIYVLPDYTTNMFLDVSWKLTRFPSQLDYFAWGVLFAAVFVPLSSEDNPKLRFLSLFGYAGATLIAVSLGLWGAWNAEFGIGSHMTRWSAEVYHLLPAMAAMLMLFFVFDRQSLGARFFGSGWLRFLGIVSYEWFLFHLPVVQWFHDHTGPSHGSMFNYLWRTCLPLALTLGFSVFVYRWFSLPIINWTRNRLKSGATR
jgi:peptidoglycan/LPS O-acetylase OafA/YrhL